MDRRPNRRPNLNTTNTSITNTTMDTMPINNPCNRSITATKTMKPVANMGDMAATAAMPDMK